MANFVYVRGPLAADWPFNAPIEDFEFALFDEQLFKAPNFADGGTYAPSGPVIVGGDGIELRATLVFDGFADTTPCMTVDEDPDDWQLIEELGQSSIKARKYFQDTGGRGFRWTVNSSWNGSDWDMDFGGGNTIALEMTSSEIAIQLPSAFTDPFPGWTDKIKLNPFDSASPSANTIYPANIPKAWGRVTTDGAGNVTLVAGAFNVASVALSTGDILVTMHSGFATVNSYVVKLTNSDGANARFVSVLKTHGSASGTTFAIRQNAGASPGSQLSAAGAATSVDFMVFGNQ